ncbi:hypothetical protein [uncultured Marinococcus sp.]|uniref:hypothetical protein n=1 Tax=uncultured Marinococcus sp. TaxID=487012 RepID=UPI0026235F76|nr:hypothetical protein [uncultured Marinococcus sp.]
MLASWIFILSIMLLTLMILAYETRDYAWTVEAKRLLGTIMILITILLLMSIGLLAYE